ncbi:hypothetical protein Lser_V15G06108 [Lactuca serriola]
MSSQDNNGLPNSFGNGFSLPYKDDFPHSDQGDSMFPSSNNGGNGYHASSTLPPSPSITLPSSRVERYESTQPLMACKHENGNSKCTHVLEMKLYIDKLGRMGVIFPREKVANLVLLSLPKSYSQFIENFYMSDHDVNLIDLRHMLIVAEVEMLKSTSEAKVFEGYNSKISLEIDNDDNSDPGKISLPNGKGSAKVKLFDCMVKRKASSEIVPCANPKRSICFYYQF